MGVGSASPVLRLALFGRPGAGKSTSSAIFRGVLEAAGHAVAVVKLAAPLYDVQDAFYERGGFPLMPGQQDGELLNFLGSHFRSVSQPFLLEDFGRRCGRASLLGAAVILCDDARPADLAGLRERGFWLVRVSAPAAVRLRRKAQRGDRTAGLDDHSTEDGVEQASADLEISNAGTMAELELQAATVAAELVQRTHRVPVDPGEADSATQAALSELVDRAGDVMAQRYLEGRHQIGVAILAGDGRVFTGLHIEAMVGRASICGEAVALGKACLADARDLRVAVAVRQPKPAEPQHGARVVPPCGLCRELLLDYAPDLRVLLANRGRWETILLEDLLPHKYVGTKWAKSPAQPAGGVVR